MAYEPVEYPKMVEVDGVKFEARDAEHEKALLAGKGDPQVEAANKARFEAEAAEAQRAADEAEQKAKDAEAAAKAAAKPAPKAKTGKKK